jgi:hypothetical protein
MAEADAEFAAFEAEMNAMTEPARAAVSLARAKTCLLTRARALHGRRSPRLLARRRRA